MVSRVASRELEYVKSIFCLFFVRLEIYFNLVYLMATALPKLVARAVLDFVLRSYQSHHIRIERNIQSQRPGEYLLGVHFHFWFNLFPGVCVYVWECEKESVCVCVCTSEASSGAVEASERGSPMFLLDDSAERPPWLTFELLLFIVVSIWVSSLEPSSYRAAKPHSLTPSPRPVCQISSLWQQSFR